jgi:hypothetical protein
MNTKSGMEIRTSLDITLKVACTIRSSVWVVFRSYASQVKIIPMPISVNAVGKPSMMATTTRDSISRPTWPLSIFGTLTNI